MERFETESMALMPGQVVRAKILSHQQWGVTAEIAGHEGVGASIDLIAQFGHATADYAELKAMYPPVGAEVDAVVEYVLRWSRPALVRLSVRPADLVSFGMTCDFCGERAILSPGGDGLVLDVRSNDGPGSTAVIAHRTCLAERIHPKSSGERARALSVGRELLGSGWAKGGSRAG
jgi:hypothetical protein